MNRLYTALIELSPSSHCSVCSPDEIAGAYVRSYVVAQTLQEAVERMCAACEQGGFEVAGIDWCVDKDKVDWDHFDSTVAPDCIKRAYSTGDVIFGELYTWPHESEETS